VTQVIIGAIIEIISKLFTKYLSNTPGMKKSRNYRNWILQTYFRQYYCKSTKTLNTGNKIACTIECSYRIAATPHTL
jgi:hypothetical protein